MGGDCADSDGGAVVIARIFARLLEGAPVIVKVERGQARQVMCVVGGGRCDESEGD